MKPALRYFLLWVVGLILFVYLAGTIRIVWPMFTHGGQANAPTSNILTIVYVRILIMAFLTYLFRLIRQSGKPRE